MFRERAKTIAKISLCVLGGVLLGANSPFAIELFRFPNTEEALKRIPFLALVVSLFGLWYQAARASFQLEIDLALKLAQRWESADLKSIRALAAQSLLRDPTSECEAVDRIGDFFEDVGYLARRKAISRYTAWQFFWAWIQPYHQAMIVYQIENEGDDADVWVQFDFLYAETAKQERAAREKGGIAVDVDSTLDGLEDFLIAEAQLLGQVPRFRITTRR